MHLKPNKYRGVSRKFISLPPGVQGAEPRTQAPRADVGRRQPTQPRPRPVHQQAQSMALGHRAHTQHTELKSSEAFKTHFRAESPRH